MYTMEYYSATKKSKITPSAATWMDLDSLTLSEVSQRKKYHVILLTCGLLKNGTDKLIYKSEIVTDVENKRMVTKGPL